MSYTLVKMLLPSSKYNIKSPTTMEPESYTVHNTGSYASAKAEMTYMVNNNNKVSYHYAVDDVNVYQGLSENRVSYHAGTRAGNYSSVSIEICYSNYKNEVEKQKFLESEKNAAKFLATRLKARGWGTDKVKRHKDWSGKNCPEKTMALGWDRFIKMVQSELDNLNGNNIKNVDYYVVVSASDGLNCRSTYSTNGSIIKAYNKNTKLHITKVSSNNWGYVEEGKGWVNLYYTTTYVEEATVSSFKSYKAITTNNLNYRKTASDDATILGTYKKGTELTISKENSKGTWGYTGKGWVYLKYTKKEEYKSVKYTVKVTTSALNCRKAPDADAELVTTYTKNKQLIITKENIDHTWGYTGNGWISLKYTTKVTTVTIAKKNFAVGTYNAYVKITTTSKSLNVRNKAVTGGVVDGLLKDKIIKVYTIAKGSDGAFWGSINSTKTKWICLKYATPVAYSYTV